MKLRWKKKIIVLRVSSEYRKIKAEIIAKEMPHKSFRLTKFFFFFANGIFFFILRYFVASRWRFLQRNSINSRKNWSLLRVFISISPLLFVPLLDAVKMTIGSSASVRLGFENLLDTIPAARLRNSAAVSDRHDRAKDAWTRSSERRRNISCYRLEWPILEFQPVKGVHIRSCEAGNVLSSFRPVRSKGNGIGGIERRKISFSSARYTWLSIRAAVFYGRGEREICTYSVARDSLEKKDRGSFCGNVQNVL